MEVGIRMMAAVLAPVLLAIIFYLLDTKTRFGRLKTLTKQIIIGVVFGVLACLATQFGVKYDDYVMNVRSAAPLTAGLIFGGPAGIISGVIGGLYRWFSVYWGMGAYTRVACSVATVLAGIISTVCRKYMFGNKKASWFYGLFIAATTEVFHMLLVFLTHMDDIKTAFEVVKHTAVIMILANCLSLFLTLVFVAMISKERIRFKKFTRPITQTFAIYLLVCVVLSFLATSFFTAFLQKNVSKVEVEHLLSINVEDVKADVQGATDRDLLGKTESIADALDRHFASAITVNKEGLRRLLYTCESNYNVSEINVVDENGVIFVSTNSEYDDFNMATGGQAEDFLCLLGSEESFVQKFQKIDFDDETYCKYAGVKLEHGGFVQVGYDTAHFQKSVKESLSSVAGNRHLGQTGFVFVYSPFSGEVISAPAGTVTSEQTVPNRDELNRVANDTIIIFDAPEGESYYILKSNVEGYSVFACIPESEANFSMDISVYIGVFMQWTVFFILFIVVFFLIKTIIVDNIHRINMSLARISGGDLSTVVDIRENEEFTSLSNDINATVSRLKEYISDAEKRIDMELAFAKSIQLSVLPSVFPPYPNKKEFDIYAKMFTAKEVGGDFYDFYMLGENKLVILIADVSGKGIPAAMFMMNAKQVIKSLTESGLGVAEAFTSANEKLCATNEAGMFVTAWMGMLDIDTGVVKFVNAGHNPPVVRHKDGKYVYFKSRPGLVLAGMDGIIYREGEFTLKPGDELFLYTDGVTEATNSDTVLFGEDRLLSVLDGCIDLNAEKICGAVKSSIDGFVGTAPQFDDITMLSLRYLGGQNLMKEITIPATLESMDRVIEFLECELGDAGCSFKTITQINVATDEIFGNIVHYAYPNSEGDATVGVCINNGLVTVVFSDSGVPFNPLVKDDPDVTKSAEEREIGGLGIFMVKKTMKSVSYEYKDGRNVLTITKEIR